MSKRDPCRRIKPSDAQVIKENGATTSGGTVRDETIAQAYSSKPGPHSLARSGQIDRQAAERAKRAARNGDRRPARFGELIAALKGRASNDRA